MRLVMQPMPSISDSSTVAVKLRHVLGLEPEPLEARMLGLDVVHRHRQMAVAVAVLVGLGTPVVDRQLDLEVRLRIAQVDQSEAVEREAVGRS